MSLSEKDVVSLFSQDFSWEQILYKIVAVEAMDPWDLNIGVLSDQFIHTIEKAETLDFKVPAKYIIIAAVLLRMKAEHLDVVQGILADQPEQPAVLPADPTEPAIPQVFLNPLVIPPNRMPLRRVMVEELIDALRKALKTSERRELKEVAARQKIDIRPENLTARINALYSRISSVLSKFRQEEVPFSQVLESWDRNSVLNNFIPLIYLDHNKKVETRQEECFGEIFVKKREKSTAAPG